MLPVLDPNHFSRPALLPERIADHLRGRIVSGYVKPGERLTELALTREYDVSRVPMREALRILATEGLIELAPHRGATVIELSEQELRELFGVRTAIEEFAARSLAENFSPEAFRTLTELNKAMRKSVRNKDLPTYERCAVHFHDLIVQASGNALLTSYYEQVRFRFRRYQAALAVIPKSAASSIDEHEHLIDCIQKRLPDAAAEATRDHIKSLIARFGSFGGIKPAATIQCQ